jgi:hypothetical protein
MESDDIESLPMDEHEQFVASEFSNLQKVLKKKAVPATTHSEEPQPVSTLMRDLKIVVLATILFLIIGHPKLDQLLSKFKLDTLTLYTIKASSFAFILFLLINRAC